MLLVRFFKSYKEHMQSILYLGMITHGRPGHLVPHTCNTVTVLVKWAAKRMEGWYLCSRATGI